MCAPNDSDARIPITNGFLVHQMSDVLCVPIVWLVLINLERCAVIKAKMCHFKLKKAAAKLHKIIEMVDTERCQPLTLEKRTMLLGTWLLRRSHSNSIKAGHSAFGSVSRATCLSTHKFYIIANKISELTVIVRSRARVPRSFIKLRFIFNQRFIGFFEGAIWNLWANIRSNYTKSSEVGRLVGSCALSKSWLYIFS